MRDSESGEDQIFPKDSSKTYTLVGLMERTSPQIDKGPEDTVFSFPIVLLWEIILLLGVTLVLFLFSLVKQAPLEEIANPMVTTDPAKAPWYFVGLQELLEHMHPAVAGVIIPGLLVVFLILLPYLDSERKGAGEWFGPPRARRIVFLSGVYTIIVMPAYILLDNAFSVRELLRDVVPQWIAQGLIPGTILGVLVLLPLLILARRKPSRREVILVLFTILFVSAIVYTISGFLFRGPGFKLYWPWEMPGGYNPFEGL